MEEAFKISEEERIRLERLEKSKGKNCGICMEEVICLEPVSERRFAIFENCTHIFCLKPGSEARFCTFCRLYCLLKTSNS